MSSADLDDADVEAVLGVLRSGRLALGPRAVEFERMMAEYVGVRHAVAVNSGTSALHLIVRALGLGPGDEVLVPSFTFAASVNAILEHDRLGYNYRLDEMSAALGCSQLARVEELLGRREAVARAYTERLGDSRLLRPQVVLPHVRMSWFVYVVTLAEGIARDAVIRELEAAGVPARAYFSPVHLQKYIRERPGLRAEGLAVTESVAARTVALPFHNLLTAAQIDYVVARLLEAAERLASR
ncbi:MAG: aminotransferase class I/II-fold pyridoxal phosphate-dependent enzyme [Acidobacteria bacterium]|nr:aminotransferase class I/II-fold pyridoxal phosphate-dependent enzyme [Acidobacteriota bacterium]